MLCRELGDIDLLDVHVLNASRYPNFLHSVSRGEDLGGNEGRVGKGGDQDTPGGVQARYDILFAFPEQTLSAQQPGGFLDRLDEAWREASSAGRPYWQDIGVCGPLGDDGTMPLDAGMPLPFLGGWFLYLGYELAAESEPVLDLPATPAGLPVAMAVRHRCALIRDHHQANSYLIAEPGVPQAQIDAVLEDVARLKPGVRAGKSSASTASARVAPEVLEDGLQEDDPAAYLQGIDRIKRYIVEGDVFQVNLSRLWKGRLRTDVSDTDLYARLCAANPAPFSSLVHFPADVAPEGAVLFSSSPERLVKRRGRRVSTRPIAGTRPRDRDTQTDRALSEELHAHPKERAEHVMLIDLERNDLGRVCEPGSVEVDELMSVESYAHVHHIVSNVSGRLRDGVTPGELIRAVFPGGTITGCPKVRCMEIIAELEGTGRGPYTGAVGYLNHNGDMDLNILIRSMLRQGREISFRAGAGIVHDSVPDKELMETRNKALGMQRSLL